MGGKLDSLRPPALSILSGDSVFDNQWVSRSLLELEPELLLVMIRYVVKEIDDGLPLLIALNDHSGDEPTPKSRYRKKKLHSSSQFDQRGSYTKLPHRS